MQAWRWLSLGPVFVASLAWAQDAGVWSVEQVLALDATATTSLGAANDGHVDHAVALPDAGPGFVHNTRRPSEARFGTVELVQALVRAAAVVDQAMPGSTLVINDIGLATGGPIAQHGSHQAGRDVDVLFYALDRDGNAMPAVGVPLEPNGKGWDFKDLADPKDDVRVALDARRTWRFVHALLEVAGDQVQRIFIAEHVRTLLLQQADKAKAPRRIKQRFEELTCQPAAPHDDHMHIRFFCAVDDIAAGCYDTFPMYPWRNQLLRAQGVRPAMVTQWPEYQARMKARHEAADARTTSNEEEHAQNATRMSGWHRRVVEFLERRKAWESEPHPGRTYCR